MSIKESILVAFAILFLFIMLFFILFGSSGFFDLMELKRESDLLAEKNKKIARENYTLYRKINRLKNDPEYIQNVARRELGLIGKDEVIIISDDRRSKSKKGNKPAEK